MDNLFLALLLAHKDCDVSVGHDDGHRVARVPPSVSIDPDLVANHQVSFKLSESGLLDCLDPVLQELMQGGRLLLLATSNEASLFLINAMLFLDAIITLVFVDQT